MGGCRCSYRNCKSATKLSGDLHFFHYPVKHRERCNQWIRNARRPEFFHLPDDQLRNKVICDLHFEPKYFTNILRKRLVHNAIPTIHAGCEDEIINENSSDFKDVQILPANDDGTIFTVDTDSMQQKSDSEPISTYSLRNGTLVPVYSEEPSETEQVLYTIDEEELKNMSYRETNESSNYLFIDPNRSENVSESYEIVFNGNSGNYQGDLEKKPQPPVMAVPRKNYVMNQSRSSSQEAMEVVYITEHDERGQSPVVIKSEPDLVAIEPVRPRITKLVTPDIKVRHNNKQLSSGRVKKGFLNQIKIHSREIASIKRALNANFKRSNKFNIHRLRGRVSPSLLGALTLNLHNKKSNFTNEEYEFLTTLYKTSPDMYNVFIEKLHWNLPDPSIVQELVKDQDK